VVALITGMEQPLGCAVGNALEVAEAIETLRGGGPPDLRDLCLALGSHLLAVAQPGVTVDAAQARLRDALAGGAALARFGALVKAQGGDVAVTETPDRILPRAPLSDAVVAARSGYVTAIDALTVGEAVRDLGAGRQKKGDALDLAAGVVLRAKVGDRLDAGQPWAIVHSSDASRLQATKERLDLALRLSPSAPEPPVFLYGVVHPDGGETRFA
jgi:thymidine phosphorylase